MTGYEYEGAILGYFGAVIIAVACAVGYLYAEWKLSAPDRARRAKR